MLSKNDFEKLKSYYNRNDYSSELRNIAIRAIKKDFNNIFDIAEIYWRGEFIKDLSARDLQDYVNLSVESKNGQNIYNCAKHICKEHKEYVADLVEAIIETKDSYYMACFAMLVNNINRNQFLRVVDAVVKTRDPEAVAELANNSQGYRTCAEGFYILDEFVDMVVNQNDDDLVMKVIEIINAKQAYARGKPSYAIPLGHAATTEQIKFADVLFEKHRERQTLNGDILPNLDDEYYKE